MGQALYRKYRSRSFRDVVGQDHVTKTLDKAIKTGRISHAYLFTGPRGVGKTSVARILAHEVNDMAYENESMELDIIEIDAASNRRIDEIRELRERVRVAPTAAKYKIYIIDEVHMLTREAFNALLKTLEEPPAHCIFILATTEAHKVPETIISRTQRFEFKPIPASQMVNHLESLAKMEKIDITPAALQLLADFGDGSFRDSIGYLDQLSSSGQKITENEVRDVLGLPSGMSVTKLLDAQRNNDPKTIIEQIEQIRDQGVSTTELANSLSLMLRNQIINGENLEGAAKLLKELVDVRSSSRPYDYLEAIVLESVTNDTKPKLTQPISESSKPLKKTVAAKVEAVKPLNDSKANGAKTFDADAWEQVVILSKSKAASLYTALRLAQPNIYKDKLVLDFEFPLHQKKVNQAHSKQLISDLIRDVSGQKVMVECIVDKKPGKTEVIAQQETAPHGYNAITNIFGASELMES